MYEIISNLSNSMFYITNYTTVLKEHCMSNPLLLRYTMQNTNLTTITDDPHFRQTFPSYSNRKLLFSCKADKYSTINSDPYQILLSNSVLNLFFCLLKQARLDWHLILLGFMMLNTSISVVEINVESLITITHPLTAW